MVWESGWEAGGCLFGAQPDAGSKRKTESGGREIYEITSGLWVGMLECGSGERVHFRNLPKRTRERILNSADERNGWSVKESQKELTKVKKQKTQEKDVYLMRRQQILEQGTSAMQNTKSVYEEQVQYWQSKNAILQQKLITNSETFKRTSTTKEVFILFTPYLSYFICLVLFSPLFANMLPGIVLFVLGTNAFHA